MDLKKIGIINFKKLGVKRCFYKPKLHLKKNSFNAGNAIKKKCFRGTSIRVANVFKYG